MFYEPNSYTSCLKISFIVWTLIFLMSLLFDTWLIVLIQYHYILINNWKIFSTRSANRKVVFISKNTFPPQKCRSLNTSYHLTHNHVKAHTTTDYSIIQRFHRVQPTRTNTLNTEDEFLSYEKPISQSFRLFDTNLYQSRYNGGLFNNAKVFSTCSTHRKVTFDISE